MHEVCFTYINGQVKRVPCGKASHNSVEWANTHENVLNNVVIGCESWCFQYYDPSTKCRTAEWRDKGKQQSDEVGATKLKIKTTLISFCDSRGIIHNNFVHPGQIVNTVFYKGVLD